MDDSEGKIDSATSAGQIGEFAPKNVVKSKRRTLVERELETSLTEKTTSPVCSGDIMGSTSRFGRSRKLKTDSEFCDTDKAITAIFKSPNLDLTPAKLSAYKINTSNTLGQQASPKTPIKEAGTFIIENQIEKIVTRNNSLSRFSAEENKEKSPAKKLGKVYIRKDLIQPKEKEVTASIMKSMFSPAKSPYKPSTNTHLSNILERSSEKYNLNIPETKHNGYLGTSSVVKTLDFDSGKKKKADDIAGSNTLSKSEIFDWEAKCVYQVGDIAWSRVGTYPFWPCIVTRDPFSRLFVKKKLYGRVERDVLHVTFFGDNGRRGWIVDNMLRKFRGLQEFEATRAGFTPQSKKKDPRFYAAFFVSDKKRQSWNVSVQEAESLMREPKRLRVDALNDLLSRTRIMRTTPKRQKSEKIVRTNSDVSLSESLYDTLFSEDDSKVDDIDKAKKTSRKKSLDVSEVVTACLDNMAAKTGISKIQKQSHMDRWLQKAKSKTPEKMQTMIVVGRGRKEAKGPNSGKKSKSMPNKDQRPFIIKNNGKGIENDTLGLLRITTAFQLNEHDYTTMDTENDNPASNQNTQDHRIIIKNGIVAEDSCGIGIISKVETLSDCSPIEEKPAEVFDVENNMSVITEELIVTETIQGTVHESTLKAVNDASESKLEMKDQKHSDKASATDKDLATSERPEIYLQRELVTANESQTVEIAIPSNKETSQDSGSPSFRITRKSKRLSLDPTKKWLKTNAVALSNGTVNGDMIQEHKKEHNDEHFSSPKKLEISSVKEYNMSNEKQSKNAIEKLKGRQIEGTFKCDPKISKMITRSNRHVIVKGDIDEPTKSITVMNKDEHLENNILETTKVSPEINNENTTYIVKVALDVSKILEDSTKILENSTEKEYMSSEKQSTNANEKLEGDQIEGTFKCDPKISKMITRSSRHVVVTDDIDEPSKSINVINRDEHLDNKILETTKASPEINNENTTNIVEVALDVSLILEDSPKKLENSTEKEYSSEKQSTNAIEKLKVDEIEGTFKCDPKISKMITRSNRHVIVKGDIDEPSKSITVMNKDEHLDNNILKTTKVSPGINNEKATNNFEVASDVSKILEDFSVTDEDSMLGELGGKLSKPELADEYIDDRKPKTGEKGSKDSDQDLLREADQASIEDLNKPTTGMRSEVDPLNGPVTKTNEVLVDIFSSKIAGDTNKSVLLNGDLEPGAALIASKTITAKEDKTVERVLDEESSEEISGVEELFEAQLRKVAEKAKQCNELLLSKNSQLLVKDSITDLVDMSVDEDGAEKESELLEEISGIEELLQAQLQKAAEESKQTKEILPFVNSLVMKKESVIYAPFMSVGNGMCEHEARSDLSQVIVDTPLIQEYPEAMEVSRVEKIALVKQTSETNSDAQGYLVDGEDPSEPESPAFEGISHDEESNICNLKPKSDSAQVASENLGPERSKAKSIGSSKVTRSKSYKYNDALVPLKDFEVKVMRMPIIHLIRNKKVLIEQVDNGKELKNVEPVIEEKKQLAGNFMEPIVKYEKKVSELEEAEKVTEPILEDKKIIANQISQLVIEDKIKDPDVIDTKKLSEKITELVIEDKEKQLEIVTEPVVEVAKKVTDAVTVTTTEGSKTVAARDIKPVREDNKITAEKNMTLEKDKVVKDKKIATVIKSETISIDSDSEDNISLAAMCRSYSEESKISKEPKSGHVSTKVCAKQKRKPSKDKNTTQGKIETHRGLEDPEFLKYLELRQDALMDENPHVTEEEAVHYLFQTWLYSESLKSDTVKSFDKEQTNLVKGQCDEPPPQPKKIRKKLKVEKDTNIEQEPQSADDIAKDRSKRKVAKAYYNENDTDFEDEMQVFEIFKMANQQPAKPKTESALTLNAEPVSDTLKIEAEPEDSEVFVDEVETLFLQLAKPKPNVFKGIPRERLCEICEKPGSLLKCKGPCRGMYHLDCIRRQTEERPEAPNGPSRGRKKKKPRGRKPKSLDDSGSQSDDKKDLNLSEEMISDEIQLESNLVIDADNFEAQLEARMQDMLKTELPDDYDYSSEDELNWNDTAAGKCEIVDVKLKLRRTENDYSSFRCNDCLGNETPFCFVCKSTMSPKNSTELRQKCQTAHCYKYYHLECLDIWPQTQFNSGERPRNKRINESFEPMTCPRHVCHTCVCDDPRGCNTRFSGDKLARCVRCPATYHAFNKCLPAGSTVLSASHIICPRHYEHRPGKVPCHVNTGWCFICALGGTLICCEYCPTSFHAECLNIKPPEGNYMCEDCETGRLPLYGEMVWVKLGHYRWWPGLILHPCEIPDNILAVRHTRGEFVVRFFGQYDHYWVNRGRVFPFQEGDSGKVSGQKSKIDEAFTMAMEHAQRAYEILKNAAPNEEEDTDIASSLLPPHYVKLKVNKPCGALVNYKPDDEENSLTLCECDPNDVEPCGPDTHCLNRMLLTECGPTCRAGDRCCNRAFENRLYPKMTPYRTSWGGWGLKTLEPIRQGQFVIEYVGELLDETEFRRRMQRKHEIRDENYYFLTLDRERMIDAGPKGNLARFMNHCCEPNCETQKWTVLGDVRVGLFALRDIPANSEVTFNYNLECAGIEKKPCLCGAKRCSGYIGAKPKQDEPQPKKARRPYKKRKPAEVSPSTSKPKVVKPRTTKRSRPKEEKELTEIEKDLLIIKNATNGLSSDSECNERLTGLESVKVKEEKPLSLKRKRVSPPKDAFNNVEYSQSVKKIKLDSDALRAVGD